MKRVTELYEGDRPREKLLAKGARALKDYELIAVMLGSGTKGQDVLKVAKGVEKLLNDDFAGLSIEKLTTVHGLGPARAAQLLAAVELSRRHLNRSGERIGCAEDVWRELKEYRTRQQEYFLSITLDGAGRIIEKRVVTVGTLNQSLVHPRELFADAIADRAAGVVIAHNHPSGRAFPSSEDRRVTRRIQEAARILGIELVDHVILTRDGWYSFAEEGEL